MNRQQSQHTPFTADDYNQPTEPLEPLPWPPYADAAGPVSGEGETVAGYPAYQPPAVYPVLPQAPLKRYHGTPPGGTTRYAQSAGKPRRSALPGLVSFVLLLVQLVLLARVVCVLFGVRATVTWLAVLFAVSDLCIQPLRVLAASINLSFLAGTQLLVVLELLVAILAYGIISRLLVRLLRALCDV